MYARCPQPVLPVGCPWFISLSGTPKTCFSVASQFLISMIIPTAAMLATWTPRYWIIYSNFYTCRSPCEHRIQSLISNDYFNRCDTKNLDTSVVDQIYIFYMSATFFKHRIVPEAFWEFSLLIFRIRMSHDLVDSYHCGDGSTLDCCHTVDTSMLSRISSR